MRKSTFNLRARPRLRRKAGFTLMEVMIVITIIGLLVALGGVSFMRILDGAKVDTTETQIRSMRSAVDLMQLHIGRYPTQEEGLDLLVQAPGDGAPGWIGPYYEDGLPIDPWGNPYFYIAPEGDGAPQIGSYGKDGAEGGDGFAEDIVR
jgi:general secretion pathway protein G